MTGNLSMAESLPSIIGERSDDAALNSPGRFNYRSYGSPTVNRAIARSMKGAEFLEGQNLIKMRVE